MKRYSFDLIIKWVYFFLMVGSIVAAVKMLFWGYGYDEDYQIAMSYRNLMGDGMFELMYEPHQSSSFLCTIFMGAFVQLTGSFSGIVIWLRICGTIIHFLISMYIYSVCKNDLLLENAGLLALIYFNFTPKQLMIPEFSIMQVWFFTLSVLFIIKYLFVDNRLRYLIFAGGGVHLKY